jgi:hypothetical protein
MSKRFDVCAPRAGKEGKTFWHRVGSAFENEKGINLVFDSLPLPDKEGRVSVFLFEPREKGEKTMPAAKADGKRVSPRNLSDDMDGDSIPF